MTDQALQRKKRLAAALRENLKRRKAQQRVRSGHETQMLRDHAQSRSAAADDPSAQPAADRTPLVEPSATSRALTP